MKRFLALIILAVGAFASAAVGGETRDRASVERDAPIPRDAQPAATPGRFPGPVINRVLDLLDQDVVVSSAAPGQVWESAVFDTSQFTRIGLRVEGTLTEGAISCTTEWQFAPGDEFRADGPSDGLGLSGRFIYGPGVRQEYGYPSGDDRSRQDYPSSLMMSYVLAPQPFAPVFGLLAKVVCGPVVLSPGDVGDDPMENPSTGAGAAGTLTDVKVLLRRE